MARFMTRRCVAMTWAEAIRLAALDQTPWSEIRQADEEVQLLHREEWWVWWSELSPRLGAQLLGCARGLCTRGLH